MRGLLPALILLAALVPVAGATPYDCTGQGVPTAYGPVGLYCNKYTTPTSETKIRTVHIEIDGAFEAGVEHRHTTGQGEYAGCSAYYYGDGIGPSSVTWGRPCAGIRHPLIP